MIDPDSLDMVYDEMYEIVSDFEDLTDEELIECRDTILKRLNKVFCLLNNDFDGMEV